jgi:hypothetical protein
MSIARLKSVLEGNWSSRLRSAGLLVIVECKMSSCQAEEDSGKNNTYSGTSLKWAPSPQSETSMATSAGGDGHAGYFWSLTAQYAPVETSTWLRPAPEQGGRRMDILVILHRRSINRHVEDCEMHSQGGV